jgi:hypothetical protein
MADTWSWQSLVQWVSPLLVVVLTFSLPRLFQRELRRLQLESETRVKRLEALEKAMSLAVRVRRFHRRLGQGSCPVGGGVNQRPPVRILELATQHPGRGDRFESAPESLGARTPTRGAGIWFPRA